MELGGYGFDKPELLKIAEEIYSLKSKKQDLELTLHSERFHFQYIPKRKHLAEHEVTFRLLWIIPVTFVVIASICMVVYYIFHSDELVANGPIGVLFLFAMLIMVFGGYTAFRLWKREIHMLTLLWVSKNTEKATSFAKKHDINTFQNDEEVSRTRIEMLESEITSIEQRILQLEERQKQLLEEKRKGEEYLRKKGVLYDENPKTFQSDKKFSLREDSMNSVSIQELHEFYMKEEQYTRNYLQQLENKVQQINKQITRIDDDIEGVKKTCFFVICTYVLLVMIQSIFSGFLGAITSVLCIFITIAMVFYAEKKCKLPLILYLVEHEHPMIQEYAFCHNMVPVRLKREEILEKMTTLQLELEGIKEKKKALDL